MAQPTPKRIVLQFPERWFHEVGAIITIFFEMHNPNAIEDYIFNIIPANHSLTKHFLVIDLHCKTIPQVDINAIEHQVFKVSKEDRFTFTELDQNAQEIARRRSPGVPWGRRI